MLRCPYCEEWFDDKVDADQGPSEHDQRHWFREAVRNDWRPSELRSKVSGPYGNGLLAALEELREVRP